MLPITPVASPPATSQLATASNTQAAQLSSQLDAASAARQQLNVAVSATGAPIAYSPYTVPQRATPAPQRNEPSTKPSLPQPPSLLPDLEIFEAKPNVPTTAAPATGRPLPALTTQESAPFVAQAAVQAGMQPAVREQEEQQRTLPQQRRLQALAGKKPGVADTRGMDAYGLALERNAGMSFTFTPTIEKFL